MWQVCYEEVSLRDVARRTDGFSLAMLSALCREAAMSAIRDDMQKARIGIRHVEAALHDHRFT